MLERPIGRGGMAAVWLANDERLDRPVAIKVLSDTVAGDDEFLGRFRREARLAASLQHPNLVRVYDFDAGARPVPGDGVRRGRDACRAGRRRRRPRPASRSRIELLGALRHIHGAGILHRDVKPHNVLIDGEGHARLTDFGIALTRDATSLTRTGHVIGTETYLAPELKRGDPATERSDLYALGIVLAECARDGAGAALWSLIDRLRDPDPGPPPELRRRGARRSSSGRAPRTAGEPTRPVPVDRRRRMAPVRPPTRSRRSRARSPAPLAGVARGAPAARRVGALAAAALAAAVALAIGLGGGGDDPAGGEGRRLRRRAGQRRTTEEPRRADTRPRPSRSPRSRRRPRRPPADGASLNQQGFDLIGAGDPEEAIPVLEDAVAALEGSGDELTYNYALFNLAHALRLAGRPERGDPAARGAARVPRPAGGGRRRARRRAGGGRGQSERRRAEEGEG